MDRELFTDLVKVASTKLASKKEVASYISQLREFVEEAKRKLAKEVAEALASNKQDVGLVLKEYMSDVESKLKETMTSMEKDMSQIEKDMCDEWYKSLNREIYKIEQLIANLPQYDSTQLEKKFSAVIFDIRNSLESLEDDERLDKKAVKGIEEIEEKIKSIELRPSKGGGARGIHLYVDGSKKGAANYLNLIAGTNVTLTYNQSNGRNDITIDASGGAPGSFSVMTATGTRDDTNLAFTFVSEPTLIIVNGTSYRKTSQVNGANAWSWSGTTATLQFPVGSGGDIYGIS